VFESKQTEVIADGSETSHTKILRLVTNGGIRWNSTYLMIERAIHLRDALTLYQSHEQETIHEHDLLDRDDWEELAHLKDLLVTNRDTTASGLADQPKEACSSLT
jgi:hypothetical protein